jgi:HEAT repeat protein
MAKVSSESSRRVERVEAITQARERGDVETVIGGLRDSDTTVRGVAARSLGLLGDRRGVEPLVRVLRGSDEGVKINALNALARIGDSAPVEEIHELACLPGPFGVRAAAMSTLGALGDRRAIDLLTNIVLENDFARVYIRPSTLPRVDERSSKRWAARKLIELRGSEAIPRLEEAERASSVYKRYVLRRLRRRLERRQNDAI